MKIKKIPTRFTIFCGVLAISLIFKIAIHAQESPDEKKGCSIINKDHDAQYISYKGLANLKNQVILQIYNNTNCSIIVETDDNFQGEALKIPTGTIRFNKSKNALFVHYLVTSRFKQIIKNGFRWGDSVYTYKIVPKESIGFYVSLNHLKNRLDIAVPFSYEWEKTFVGAGFTGGVQHQIYYLFTDLPKEIL